MISGQDVASSPWLSVVIPSYRGEQWIGASLRSIAAEAPHGVEVLLIDSSPTRATLDIAVAYSNRLDLRIFERRDLDSWHTKTNFGVEAAKAAHISWLGVDDIWLPGRVAATRAWIASAPNVPLHLSASDIIDKSGRRLGKWRCPLPPNRELPSSFVRERLLVQNFIAAPSPVFRKDAWLGCGGLDEKLWYTADWDIWLKLALLGPVYYHDVATIGFRIHAGSLTVAGSRNLAAFEQQMQLVLERHLLNLPDGRKDLARVARASIAINTALASASSGDVGGLVRAVSQVLLLGPRGIHNYLRDSRIFERVAPRVRARARGVF
jgi:glycosyltransferase involved in cell wall biosynthesis